MMDNDFFDVRYDESCAKLCTLKPKNILLHYPKSIRIEAINFGLLCWSSRRRIGLEMCSVVFEGLNFVVLASVVRIADRRAAQRTMHLSHACLAISCLALLQVHFIGFLP